MGKGRQNKANPQEGDWGWLAGLIDGDGCISIQRQRGRFRSSIIIVNKKPDNILKLMRLFGGSLGDVKRNRSSSYVAGVYYRWVVSATEDVMWILNNCIHHMAEKRRKASFAIRLCELRREFKSLHVRSCPRHIVEQMEIIHKSSLAETECHPRLTTDATVRSHGMVNHESSQEIDYRLSSDRSLK